MKPQTILQTQYFNTDVDSTTWIEFQQEVKRQIKTEAEKIGKKGKGKKWKAERVNLPQGSRR